MIAAVAYGSSCDHRCGLAMGAIHVLQLGRDLSLDPDVASRFSVIVASHQVAQK